MIATIAIRVKLSPRLPKTHNSGGARAKALGKLLQARRDKRRSVPIAIITFDGAEVGRALARGVRCSPIT